MWFLLFPVRQIVTGAVNAFYCFTYESHFRSFLLQPFVKISHCATMLPFLSDLFSRVSQGFHGTSRLQTFRSCIVLRVLSLPRVRIFYLFNGDKFLNIGILVYSFLKDTAVSMHSAVFAWALL